MVPALAAVAGVVAAHVVDYAVLFPQAGVRADHLQATGHGYWPAAAVLAVGAAAVALAVTAGRGALRALRDRPATASGRRDLAWLLLCQGLAFVAMEAGERGMAGLPPAIILRSPEFWFGLVLQVPVAWLAIRVLAVVERAAFHVTRAAAGRHARPVAPPRPLARPAPVAVPCAVDGASPARPRAPPLAA